MKNFRLYAESKGWELIDTSDDISKIRTKITNFVENKYHSYMIIEHDFDKDCDSCYDMGKVLHKSYRK